MADEPIAFSGDEAWCWMRFIDDAVDILRNVVGAKIFPPAVSLYIIEDKASARVRRAATHDTWR